VRFLNELGKHPVDVGYRPFQAFRNRCPPYARDARYRNAAWSQRQVQVTVIYTVDDRGRSATLCVMILPRRDA
jgi:hypothetical protein